MYYYFERSPGQAINLPQYWLDDNLKRLYRDLKTRQQVDTEMFYLIRNIVEDLPHARFGFDPNNVYMRESADWWGHPTRRQHRCDAVNSQLRRLQADFGFCFAPFIRQLQDDFLL